VLAFVLRVVANTAVWLVLQSLLLSRRVPIRRLLPGSVAIGGGSAILSLYSALWMPRLIEENATRYGIIGITFALLTWLILVCFLVVVAAVLSAEMGGGAAGTFRSVTPDGSVGTPSQQDPTRSGGSSGTDDDGADRRQST
jgi:membrane protein